MNILIIADPIQKTKPHSDTGLMLAHEAFQRQHRVFWTTPDCVGLLENKTALQAQKIKSIPEKKHAVMEPPQFFELDFFDTVWIRKDPPFDTHYVSLCWLLRLTQKNKPIVLNPPEVLLLNHEKLLPMLGLHQGYFEASDLIPSALSFTGILKNKKHVFFKHFKKKEVILKPWLGHGGHSVKKIASLLKSATHINKKKSDAILIQPFQKEVTTLGERRVFFINGNYCGSIMKRPKKGGFISNFAQGGTGELKELNPKEIKIISKIEFFLKENKIFIAGVDLLNGLVSEINITAPTLFPIYKELTRGTDLAALYVDEVEKLF